MPATTKKTTVLPNSAKGKKIIQCVAAFIAKDLLHLVMENAGFTT